MSAQADSPWVTRGLITMGSLNCGFLNGVSPEMRHGYALGYQEAGTFAGEKTGLKRLLGAMYTEIADGAPAPALKTYINIRLPEAIIPFFPKLRGKIDDYESYLRRVRLDANTVPTEGI